MATQVQAPDGTVIQFPGTMDDAAITAAMKKLYPPKTAISSASPAGGAGGSWKTTPVQGQDFLSRNPRTGMPQKIIPASTGINAATGGGIGAMLGGPAGATIGGAGGRLVEQAIKALEPATPVPSTPLKAAGDVGMAGLEQGALEYVGGTLLGKAAKGVSSSADRAMNRILGLKLSNIPKWERGNVDAVEEVGRVVNKEIRGAASLNSLANKINSVKSTYSQIIDNLVRGNSAASKYTPLHQIIDNRALQAANEIELRGNKAAADQILRTADTLRKNHPFAAKPEQLLDLKRLLLDEKEWASTGGATTKTFRKGLYHDLNDAIKAALPTDAAAKFAPANRTINRLIIAEDAVKAKQVSKALAPTSIQQIAKRSAAPLIGAGAGAGTGYYEKRTVGGTLAGAAAGAAIGAGLESTAARSGGVLARRAAAKAAKGLSRTLPQAVRAVQAVEEKD